MWIRDHTSNLGGGGGPKLGMPYEGPGRIVRYIRQEKAVVYEVQSPRSRNHIIHHDLKPLLPREVARLPADTPRNCRDTTAASHLARSANTAPQSTIVREVDRGRRERATWDGLRTMPPCPYFRPSRSEPVSTSMEDHASGDLEPEVTMPTLTHHRQKGTRKHQ